LRADAEAIRDEARRTGREAIARERTDLVAQSDVLGEQARSAQSRYDTEVADLNAQLTPLQIRYAELERLAIPYQRRIRDIAIRIADLERRAAATEDQNEKDRLLREADRWRFEIDRDRRDLRIIEREGAVVSAQAARVQTQVASAARQYQAQQNSLAAQARKIEARRKALDREEASLDDPAKTPAAALSKLNSLSSLTVYIKFPLEDERSRLLAEVQGAE
jgi:predicted  nucleic acid-binding Zn-ribbon protein